MNIVTDRCPACDGYAVVPGMLGDLMECVRCKGSGRQPPRCPRCGAFGRVGEPCATCATRHPSDNRWSIIVELQTSDVARAREIITAALTYRMGVRPRTKTVLTEHLERISKPEARFQEVRPAVSGAVKKGKEIGGRKR